MRPGGQIVQGHVQPGILAKVDVQLTVAPLESRGAGSGRNTVVHGGETAAHAEAFRVGPGPVACLGAHETVGPRRQADGRPRSLRALVRTAQRDDHATGGGVGDAPEIAFHRDAAMGAPGIAEKGIGSG